MRWSWREFKLKLYAWWEGRGADDLPAAGRRLGSAARVAKASAAPLVVAPLAPWENPRIRIMQLIWGSGYHKPGGPDHILGLVKPFALDPSKSILELGAGLGGAARTVASEFGVWVTSYEADTELVHAGKQLSLLAGLDRKAEIQRFIVNDFKLSANRFDCIFSSEALFAYAGKHDLLGKLQQGLKPRGQLSIIDFVLAPGVAPQDERLAAVRSQAGELWRPEQYERRFRELSLDLRVAENMTDAYRRMILAGWAKFAQGDPITLATARAFPDAVMAECELWFNRLKAMEEGLLQVIRFYAINKSAPKLMSDW